MRRLVSAPAQAAGGDLCSRFTPLLALSERDSEKDVHLYASCDMPHLQEFSANGFIRRPMLNGRALESVSIKLFTYTDTDLWDFGELLDFLRT